MVIPHFLHLLRTRRSPNSQQNTKVGVLTTSHCGNQGTEMCEWNYCARHPDKGLAGSRGKDACLLSWGQPEDTNAIVHPICGVLPAVNFRSHPVEIRFFVSEQDVIPASISSEHSIAPATVLNNTASTWCRLLLTMVVLSIRLTGTNGLTSPREDWACLILTMCLPNVSDNVSRSAPELTVWLSSALVVNRYSRHRIASYLTGKRYRTSW